MANFAVIDDSNQEVINVIVADTIQTAEQITNRLCVDITENPLGVGIGWYYIDGVFTKTLPTVPEPTPTNE